MNESFKGPARERLGRIFSYIRELTRLRTPPVGEVSSYPWTLFFSKLPSHPTIQHRISSQDADQSDGILLRVIRPTETKCPDLPIQLKDWIKNGWDQLSNDPIKIDARNTIDKSGQTTTEYFEDDSKRREYFAVWIDKRNSWKAAEVPVREAGEVFSNLFNLLGRMQRESEKFQLYIGDGHLIWTSAQGNVSHPLLLQKVELEFNSSVPEFIIRESDDAPDLYSELLRFHELDGTGIQVSKVRLSEGNAHPLENGHTSEFLKFVIHRFFDKGQYFESYKDSLNTTNPHIYRDPVLFLGSRTQSFIEALDKLIEAIPKMEEIPEALYRIVGFDPSLESSPQSELLSGTNTNPEVPSSPVQEVDYLLTKPANKEQERIISRLETSGSVLVQGPPGTGKSHTIANIIGHLLANGKTVLVASHTAKALRVVREKVAKPLRPLCVSVLDNDVESKSQLEESINGIVGYAKVQKEIDHVRSELQDVSAQYVEKLAWLYQLDRTGLKERQAITGWQQLQAKLTKTGRGKLDAVRKREAKKLLTDCKGSVPVWVMPLSKVFESFDLTTTKFDVVILDEASQSDITALVAFSIAKQIIVVGDSEQVTPQAVGQELTKVQGLIDELLEGVPNRMLYDGKTSVYDLAEQSFGETIRLVEHFRCVPNIIQFSNLLSYNGEIKPLRESSSSPFEEHLIVHRVDTGSNLNKVNKNEAIEIASLIAAMTETKEYSKATIGVISLLGQEQAVVIDTTLQKYLRPEIYQGHGILCGNASQFQGDERDVILISMVDTCDEPPLRMRQTEDFKKSYNVAASRARDQLWIIHSLNPATDLKPGDLRLRLIQHAENPQSITNALETASLKAESPFERMVMADLIQAGFRVTPQWEVGAYRIDMIIEGKNNRIALECDGDRFHPPEKLADDIQRQLVLERLGWKFIRIRGTEYFRDPKKAMNRVFGELAALGIEKLGPAGDSAVGVVGPSELRKRILNRAFQLREQWLAEEAAKESAA